MSEGTPESSFPLRQRFSDRLAGRPGDTALTPAVSEPLARALRGWINLACQHDDRVAQRVTLRLEIRSTYPDPARTDYIGDLQGVPNQNLLDVVDQILRTHRAADWFNDPQHGRTGENYAQLVAILTEHLIDAGSAYTVADSGKSLEVRVDATVTAAAAHAVDVAPPTAGDLLREAWQLIYGLHPDPSDAYGHAVRAVEAVACPLVLPNETKPTLGKVNGELRSNRHKWKFVLANKDGEDSIEPILAMLERLWESHSASRHAGGTNSREQTQAEGETAVHLAATLVQLLSTAALSRR